MQYRRLGPNCGVRVRALCLGTMNFGGATPENESGAIMDRALADGVIYFRARNHLFAIGLPEE